MFHRKHTMNRKNMNLPNSICILSTLLTAHCSCTTYMLKIFQEFRIKCVKANSLPPCHFYGKMPYSRISARTLKSDILMIIRIQETTLLIKKFTSTFIISPVIDFPILNFWAYERNHIMFFIKEAIALWQLVLLCDIDPS